ncbi:MAG: hypothetical protein WDA16_03215 [Candidatus Thermoplasmatota archaeon]
MIPKKHETAKKTLRILDRQLVAYDDITRSLERAHYQATGQYRRLHQWEVLDRLLEVPEVKHMRDDGTHNDAARL